MLEVATKAVLALAEVMATAPVIDCAFTFAFRLARAAALRLPDDLTHTPEAPETAPVVKVPALVVSRSTMPALLVTLPTEALPAASSVMLPVAEPDVDVKVLPAVKVAAPPLTTKDETVSPVLDVASKAVLALAEAMVTELSSDSARTFAFKLVRAPLLRWSEDLSNTPEIPETAPVVKVPALVSRSTMPALVVT